MWKKNQEALDEAQASLKQLKQTYELKRAASASTIWIQQIQRDRALEAIRCAQGNAARMIVHSLMEEPVGQRRHLALANSVSAPRSSNPYR